MSKYLNQAFKKTGLLLVLLLAGALAISWLAQRTDRQLREELLAQTRLVAGAVDIKHVQALTGAAADLASPEYLRLKEQLAAVRATDPKCRFVYLMGRRVDGTVFFFADSEQAGSADESPAGQVYEEVSKEYLRAFEAKASLVEGPITDHWGIWVSAHVPLTHPQSGELIGMLGMDIDARDWKWARISRTAFPIGLVLLVMIGLAAELFSTGRVSESPKPVLRRLLPGLSALLFLLFGGGYWGLMRIQENHLRDTSLLIKQQASGALQQLLAEQARGLEAVLVSISRDADLVAELKTGDRARLLERSKPLFDELNARYQVTHFYFSDAQRVCLLRVHHPETYGDRLDRGSALEAERSGQVASGIELDPLGTLTLRVVRPVFEDGHLLGYLEIGKEIEEVLSRIVEFQGMEKILAIRKDALDRRRWEEGMALLGREADWDCLPGHAVFYASIPMPAEAEGLIGGDRHGHGHAEALDEIRFDDKVWRAMTQALADTSGREIGELLLLHDVTDIKTAHRRLMVAAGMGALVLLASLLALVFVMLRRTDAGILARQKILRESEALLTQSQQIAHTGSWKLDLTTNHLTWTDEVYRIFGCEPQEFAPTYETFLDFVHPEDRAALDEAYSHSKREGSDRYDMEHRIVRRNSGEVRYVHERCVHERDAAGVIILSTGMVHDITERKQTEEALRESEERFRVLLENIETVAVQGYGLDGTVQYWNKGSERLYGYPQQEAIGCNLLDLIIPSQMKDAVAKAIRTMAESGQPVPSGELFLMHKDGSRVPVISSHAIVRVQGRAPELFCLDVDITERKQAEERLRESEENLRITLNSIGDAVISTDVDGRVVSMNPVAESLTGWTMDEASGQPLAEVFRICNETSRKTVESPVDHVLKNGQMVGRDNHTLLITKDGRETPIADSGAPIKNSDGEITGVVLVFRDQTDERAARRALQKSQQRLESMFRAAPVGIGLVRERAIIEANQRLYEMTGYNAEELIGQNARMLYPSRKEYEHVGVEKYRQIQETGTGSIETVWQRKDGARIDVMLSSTPLDPTDLLQGVTFTALDITERKRLQNAIEKRIVALTQPLSNEAYVAFDTLFNLEEIQQIQDEFADATGTAAIIIQPDGTPITEPSNFSDLCNLIRATEKGCENCLKSNQATGAYHSGELFTQRCMSCGLWTAGASIMVGGKHIASWLAGQVRDETKTDEAMRRYAREIGADEEQIIAAFHEVPVMSEAHFRQVAVAFFTLANQLSTSAYQNMQQARFISEQKQTESKLNRLSTAIEQSPETVVITDTEGTIHYVNPAFETTTGYTSEEAIGQNPRILKSGKQEDAFYAEMWNTLKAGWTWEGRMVNKRKDGSLFTEEASITPVKDSNGTIINFVGIKRDITAELEREELFRQSQKMDSVGQLAGGIAHDFNNILQGIMGFSEILEYSLEKGSQNQINAIEIKKAAKQAAGLTRQLLTFSRKQPVNIVELDLNDVVHDSLALLNILLGEKIKIVLELDPELPSLKADHAQITQVIMNLAVNARDAMVDSGRLSIVTECLELNADDAARLAADAGPGRYAVLSITDTGSGIPEGLKHRIFDPFFTTKEVGSGTGLGLSVVYGIVKQHKGAIGIYSEDGKGACFRIYFPLGRQAGAEALKRQGHRDPPLRILVVEDDPEVACMVKEMLIAEGYLAKIAASGEEGLELIETSAPAFDLLISDMELPGIRGDQLAETIRATRPDLPVLLFSGYRDHKLRWSQIERDGYIFISKPFTNAHFFESISHLLRKRTSTEGG